MGKLKSEIRKRGFPGVAGRFRWPCTGFLSDFAFRIAAEDGATTYFFFAAIDRFAPDFLAPFFAPLFFLPTAFFVVLFFLAILVSFM